MSNITSSKVKAVKGMPDVYGIESRKWKFILDCFRQIFEAACFEEIETPILEELEVFQRGIGEVTDIVEKEMYVLQDRNGRALAMRPEGTAGVVRAYIDHYAKENNLEQRLFYFGPMFRYERPQKGRYRQFHQIGAEVFGPDDPRVDAELIQLLVNFLAELKINNYELVINSLAKRESRQLYLQKLTQHLETIKADLCGNCQQRIIKNPLRVLDCKVPSCLDLLEEAPLLIDHLDDASQKDFDQLQEYLTLMGVAYRVDPKLVRGLDYYESTAFEFTSDTLGAQSAFAGGGRYNQLVNLLGGPEVSAIGFGIGMERLALLMDASLIKKNQILFLASLGEDANQFLYKLLPQLRRELQAAVYLEQRDLSLKAKLKRAHKMNADYALILGSEELQANKALLKNMESGEQSEISLKNFIYELKSIANTVQ